MKNKNNGIRTMMIALVILSIITVGVLASIKSFRDEGVTGGIIGIIISLIILGFFIFIFRRSNKSIKRGYPLKDERSNKITQKAMSMSFLVSLYLLLAIGFLSEDLIKFRDVSQATGVTVGGMAILFLIFWVYYSKKEI